MSLKFWNEYHRHSLKNKKRLGFGGGSQTSTTQTQNGPWSGQQYFLSNVFGNALNQYNDYTPQYYGYTGTAGGTPTQTGGSTVAPMNSQETSAISQLGNLGMNGTTGLTAANNAITNYANGNMLNASTNPGLQSVEQQAAASVTPSLMGAMTMGNTDNPGVALAASNGVANAVGNLAYNNYNTQTQNQINAASMAPYLYNTQLSGTGQALTAGQLSQQQAQNELNNQVNAYNYYQQLPYNQLNQYANLINGQYGVSGTSTNTQPTQTLFGSLFSDRRLKKDIKKLFQEANGLWLYAFKYIWDETERVGYMADEVKGKFPEAVGNILGFETVNYGMVK